MNIQEKRNYFKENAHYIPTEERQSFDFNLACVLTKNSVGMESGKMATLEEVVSTVRGYNTKIDENLKRSIFNFYKAYNMMLDYLKKNENPILTEDILKDLHAMIVDGLVDGGGLYRNVNIKIKGSMHTPCDYIKVYDRMKKYIYDINHTDKTDFEAIAYAHLQLAKIHPFLDGNGRLARLILNFFLIQYGYIPISIPAKRRLEYFDLLEEFKVNKNPIPFENFIRELVEKEYDRLIEVIEKYKK
ncbi:MAG: Fic family protein [Prevotella sp.]|nr:Fic family protein [Staphylococcus sp.]MCM1349757.1 Fic family protein [Prevotella sp.]